MAPLSNSAVVVQNAKQSEVESRNTFMDVASKAGRVAYKIIDYVTHGVFFSAGLTLGISLSSAFVAASSAYVAAFAFDAFAVSVLANTALMSLGIAATAAPIVLVLAAPVVVLNIVRCVRAVS